MMPGGLQHIHFQQAIKEIDELGVPNRRRSLTYDLLMDGKKYPPKYVISIAHKFVNGEEWPSTKFNSVETKNYFIGKGYKILNKNDEELPEIQPEDGESTYPEGIEIYKQHKQRERDPKIVKTVKENRLLKDSDLKCDVCDFSFRRIYGELGAGFIEAHHTIPVSELRGKRKTKIEEIALVCSNCHRMLHSGKQLLSIEELQEILRTQRKKL